MAFVVSMGFGMLIADKVISQIFIPSVIKADSVDSAQK
jgi:hypothetical protein